MPDATSPDNIWFLNASDLAPGPHTLTAQIAGSVQAALNYRQISTFRWATIAEKDAEVDMDYGSLGYCEENGYLYVYDVFSDEWVALNGAPDAGTASRTTNSSASSSIIHTQVALDTFSLSGGFTSGTNSLIVPSDGWYTVSFFDRWEPNSTNRRAGAIFVNGSEVAYISDLRTGNSTNSTTISGTGVIQLSGGDAVTLGHWQNSGSSLNSTYSYLSVAKIR